MYSQMSATESHSLPRSTVIRSMAPSVWAAAGGGKGTGTHPIPPRGAAPSVVPLHLRPMARPKPKKKRRSRSDPARKEAAARRDEARRRAVEERRRAAEAAERRGRLLRLARRGAIALLIGGAVVLVALFIFRAKEVHGAEKVDASQILTDLGYTLPDPIDVAALPAPACGLLTEAPSADQAYSDLRNGAVMLWYPAGDDATASDLAASIESNNAYVVIAPSGAVTDAIVATSWQRRLTVHSTSGDDLTNLTNFIDYYRGDGEAHLDCPIG
jgi:hypothetical protein